MHQLEEDRSRALENKVLISEDLSWVKGDITFNGDKIPVKIRLKGDWTDHLKGDKWSMRVKVRGEEYILGMKEFSFQAPETRGDLNEWVYHKILEKEDILTTRFEYCKLSINGVAKGVFALEEHFTKLLLERQNRREGPIVKFDENPLWQSRIVNDGATVSGVAFAQSAQVNVFSKKKTAKSPVLAEQYQLAKNLLYQEQFKLANAAEIYDIERLAKLIAIMDITKSYHGWFYHNQRWYYNGVTGKLEPIGFDGDMGKEPEYWTERPFMGYINEEGKNPFFEGNFSIEPFRDPLFVELYFFYLQEYFTEDYVANLLTDIGVELNSYQKLIQTERPEYVYHKSLLSSNLKTIKLACEATNYKKAYSIFTFQKMEIAPSVNQAIPVNNATVMAYTSSEGIVDVLNVHDHPVTILGVGNSVEDIIKEEKEISAFSTRNEPVWMSYETKGTGDKIFYSVAGIDSIFSSDIVKSKRPSAYTPMQELLALRIDQMFLVNENKLTIPAGEYGSTDNIVIPKGYELIIEAGTKINLMEGAKIISYSPVFANGTAEMPIIITSSDSTANGFTVLQASEESILRHVHFSNMNTLNYNGWVLTGGVSFYESDVLINNCSFVNNQCEDGLNIIRSKFVVDSSLFQYTFSDAFDGDFCIGKVLNSRYESIGNDAIDFSGSDIYVENCEMTGVGDKGISIGENSSVTARNTTIKMLFWVLVQRIYLMEISKMLH